MEFQVASAQTVRGKRGFAYSTTVAGVFVSVALAFSPAGASSGLRQPDNTSLKQFGFASGPEVNRKDKFIRYYDVARRVVGPEVIVRTGLEWDPTKQDVPSFEFFTENKLEPALARDIIVLPRISAHGPGGFRIPTDAQWTKGLRSIVRMLGPGGIYAKGGTYVRNGRTIRVAAHPGFEGLTDFELWNEPDSRGSVGGKMTPAKMAHLLKIGSAVMREEAARLGFKINIIGPGFDGIEVADVQKLWQADNSIFKSIDTLSVHAYSRLSVAKCDPAKEKVRCIKSLQLIRDFLDAHGGKHVHLANTEGGYAGARGSCLGPQVLTEEVQKTYSEEALKWVRARPNLNLDFWITYQAIDGTGTYPHPCDSGKYDNAFWKQKLGVVRADLSLKPWGARLTQLATQWREGGADADAADEGGGEDEGSGETSGSNPSGPDKAAPTVPTNLSASGLSSTQVQLSWNPSDDNVGVVRYRIFRNNKWIATPKAATYTDRALRPGTQYTYKIRAVDAATNISAFSRTLRVMTPR